MYRSISIRLIVAIGALVLAASGLPPDTPVAFRTVGGDAWTFEKSLELTVGSDRCDSVAVSSPRATTLHLPTASPVTVEVPLAAGDNEVRAECRKDGMVHGEAARQRWRVRLRDAPRAWIRPSLSEQGLVLDGGSSEPAPTSPQSGLHFEWRARAGNPAELAGLPAQGHRVVVPPPKSDGEYYVKLRATDDAGRSDESTVLFRVRAGRLELIDPAHGQPSWIEDAIIYGVVPQFFGHRGLADVTARLDHLAALGVDTIWLSPIMASPPGDFGYAVTNLFRLRPDLGNEADLRELIRSAHARGIRVILDFVPNHLSSEHAYFTDAEARSRGSPYFDFFARTADGKAKHYFEWKHLPNLNYDHPEVQRLVIEAFAHWVREFDVDGFRVDVAWGPRQRAPEFWPHWRAELKRIKPDLLLIAEASARDPYYGSNGFDAAYDWTDKLGEWAWREAFDDPAHIARRLRTAIERSASTARVVRFLENNDTGARFLSRHGPATTRVAAAMLLTLPGIPALYTGQAIGAAYEPYGNTPPIMWNEDPHGMQEWYSRLIALRRSERSLRSDAIRFVDPAPAENVLAYVRSGPSSSDKLLVLLNYASEPARLPAEVLRTAIGSRAVDLLGHREVQLESGSAEILLGGHQVMVLKGK